MYQETKTVGFNFFNLLLWIYSRCTIDRDVKENMEWVVALFVSIVKNGKNVWILYWGKEPIDVCGNAQLRQLL